MPAQRAVPQRTCVTCRSTTGKRELVRIVRTPAGNVAIDLTGKANGRGAYLCRSLECWDTALRRDKLSAALKVKIAREDRDRLASFAARMRESVMVAG